LDSFDFLWRSEQRASVEEEEGAEEAEGKSGGWWMGGQAGVGWRARLELALAHPNAWAAEFKCKC